MFLSKSTFLRIRITLTTGLIAIVTLVGSPAISQEAESEESGSILVESSIVVDVDPSEAMTVEDVAVPIDQLDFLLKPLTVEELQVEAAAWLLLLKDKAQEISTTEIAIKRKNQVIQQEEEAVRAIEEAEEKLAIAEAELEATEPGTPQYERATEKSEDAKQALLEANQAIQDVLEAKEKLEADENIQEAIAEAETEEDITKARRILTEAEKSRDELAPESEAYEEATPKIDALNLAIVELERVEETLEGVVPESPEYEQVFGEVEQARTEVQLASDTVVQSGLAPTEAESDTSIESEDTGAALEEIAENIEDSQVEATPNAEESEATEGEETTAQQVNEAAEQIEGNDELLEEAAEADADLKNQLVVNVTELQGQQTGIVERFKTVLNALEAKGGDVEPYRLYIDAVSGIELDVTDTEGLGFRLVSWVKSEEGGIRWGIKIGQFLGIIVLSWAAAEVLAKTTNYSLKKFGGASNLLREFVVFLVRRGTLALGVLLALTSLGVSLGPILALVGGASFVAAFALQSNLGNFASGLMIMLNKPFDVGDEVKVAGYWSYVESISLASTRLKDFNGNLVTVPNNTVWEGDIVNYTHSEIRAIEIPIHVHFSQDISVVDELWQSIAAANPKTLDDPAPYIFPWNSFYETYIWIGLKTWTKTDDYWDVYVELLSELQTQIYAQGINMARPETDVYFSPASPLTSIVSQMPGNSPHQKIINKDDNPQ